LMHQAGNGQAIHPGPSRAGRERATRCTRGQRLESRALMAVAVQGPLRRRWSSAAIVPEG
jgi:hypothetical protein